MVDLIFIRWVHSLYIMDLLNLRSFQYCDRFLSNHSIQKIASYSYPLSHSKPIGFFSMIWIHSYTLIRLSYSSSLIFNNWFFSYDSLTHDNRFETYDSLIDSFFIYEGFNFYIFHLRPVIDLNSVIHLFDIIDLHSPIHSKPIIYSYYVDSLK